WTRAARLRTPGQGVFERAQRRTRRISPTITTKVLPRPVSAGGVCRACPQCQVAFIRAGHCGRPVKIPESNKPERPAYEKTSYKHTVKNDCSGSILAQRGHSA